MAEIWVERHKTEVGGRNGPGRATVTPWERPQERSLRLDVGQYKKGVVVLEKAEVRKGI
jgi:hypothetical protein